MSLGILKVGASLKEQGVDVRVLDLSGETDIDGAIRRFTAMDETHVFGITSTTPQLPFAIKISHYLRKYCESCRLIIGGPHPTLSVSAHKRFKNLLCRERAKRLIDQLFSHFDIIVSGDGELAIMRALDAERGSLIDADEVASPSFLTSKAFNELPFPDRSLLDVNSYHFYLNGQRGLSLIAQLGCPFSCGFCAGRSSPSFRRIRLRDPSSVIMEIQHLRSTYGVKAFMFYDDELNVNPRFSDLMKGLIEVQTERGEQFTFRGCIKAELFTAEQASLMKEAGFHTLLIGFESGSERVLQNINKKASVEDNTKCLEVADAHGISVKALMSIGHPGESEATVEETHRWLMKVRPQEFDVSIITILPGTPYYDESTPCGLKGWVYTSKNGDRLYSTDLDFSATAAFYKGDPDGDYESYVWTDFLNARSLVSARDYLERSIRSSLQIPYPTSALARSFEHSMGQFGNVTKSTQKDTQSAPSWKRNGGARSPTYGRPES